MIRLIYYKPTGEITQYFECPDFAESAYVPPEDLQKLQIEEAINIADYRVDVIEKILIALPPRLSSPCTFNYISLQWELDLLTAEASILKNRLEALKDSDWTDTVSAQTRLSNWQEWQDYRQALRDITLQEGYPLNVVFPTQPN